MKNLDPYSIGILDRPAKRKLEGGKLVCLDPYSIGILDRQKYEQQGIYPPRSMS